MIIPKYFNKQIMDYKLINDNNYKYFILNSFNEVLEEKYNLDLLGIGMQLYDKYKTIKSDGDDDDKMSYISDVSNLSDISNLSELLDN
jgi:hypothetical protein